MAQLSIPDPCSENWSDMRPVGSDCRYCGVCEKQIIDFTQKTDAEMMSLLLQGPGKICGRFRDDQLNRPMRVAARRSGIFRMRGGLTAAAASMAALLAAQQPARDAVLTPVQTERELTERFKTGRPKVYHFLDEQDILRTISGKVVDAVSEKGLPGVNVALQNTKYGATTDAEGVFSFQVPLLNIIQNDTLVIQFNRSGYAATHSRLPERVLTEDVSIIYPITSESVIPSSIATPAFYDLSVAAPFYKPKPKPSLFQRTGRFFKNLFRKKKKYTMGCPRF